MNTYNNRQELRVAAISCLIIVLLAAFALFVNRTPTSWSYVNSLWQIINTVAAVYLVSGSALIVSNIQRKGQRIREFMVPESKLRKFVARYVHLMVLIPVAAIIGICVGDLLQMLLSALALGEAHSIVGTIASHISPDLKLSNMHFGIGTVTISGVTMVLVNVYANTVFLVLGTIFRRHAWIKSNVIVGTSFVVIVIAGALAFAWFLAKFYGDGNYEITFIGDTWLNIIACTALALLSAFNYWLAYRIYSRMQIVTNRWHNL